MGYWLRLVVLAVACLAHSCLAFFQLGGPSAQNLPRLYDGWFKKGGDIERGMVSAVKASLKGVGKANAVEVLFPPVPNFDEVKIGTPLNQQFGQEMAADLGMVYKPGCVARTYLTEFSNVYWAKKLAAGLGGNVWGVFCDRVKKEGVVTKPGKLKLASFNIPSTYEKMKKGDTVIIVSPGIMEQWSEACNRFPDQKIIFLNAAVNVSYGLGGPIAGLEQAYFVKRISKGFIYKAAPGPWTTYLEKPDGSVEVSCAECNESAEAPVACLCTEVWLARQVLEQSKEKPTLGEVSNRSVGSVVSYVVCISCQLRHMYQLSGYVQAGRPPLCIPCQPAASSLQCLQ
ncbi:unnamed protein product [Chrysoparadoxa australica]